MTSNPQDNLDEWSKDQLVRYARALARDYVTSNPEVPYWHPAASELDYWKNECGRLHVACADRYDEIERLRAELAAEVTRLTGEVNAAFDRGYDMGHHDASMGIEEPPCLPPPLPKESHT